MSLFKKRREQVGGMDWSLLAGLMLGGYELERAEAEGYSADEQTDRVVEVRNAVLKVIGGQDRFTEALVQAYADLNTADADAAFDRAMTNSGYAETRERLFPDGESGSQPK
jgi:hypothetical protein